MGERIRTVLGNVNSRPLSAFVMVEDDTHMKSVVSQVLAFDDFTDNEDATGYVDVTAKLPALAIPLGWKAVVSEGFTGDTTAVMQVGIEGDLDKFSGVATASCLAAATVAAPANNDALLSATEETIRVTVTGGAGFGAITAGAMVVTLYYMQME